MRPITLFDTGIASNNAGDEIIMDAVRDIVRALFPRAFLYRVPTHDVISGPSRRLAAKSALGIVGGSNLLKPRLMRHPLWHLRLADAFALRDIVLLGVGYQNYDVPPTAFTRWFLGRILHPRFIHSVRDSYTATHLRRIVPNVVNTSCPTTWTLTPAHCATIPAQRAREALTFLTFYNRDPAADGALLDLLVRRYERVHFWPQQYEDLIYLRSLGDRPISIVAPTVADYDAFLDAHAVDVVGSRLHGGIRALQRRRRALVLAIDNRAREIARDTGLPVADRSDLAAVERWIAEPAPTRMHLPDDAIAAWKSQFAGLAAEMEAA